MLLLPVYTDLQEKKKEGLPTDFLWSLLALVNFMRLSLLKAAHAVMSGAAYRKSKVREHGAPVQGGRPVSKLEICRTTKCSPAKTGVIAAHQRQALRSDSIAPASLSRPNAQSIGRF